MDKERMKGFTQKVFADMAGGMAAGLAYLGTKTGLFEAMAGKGALTQEQVVADSGLQARYVEEWLAGMTAAGYLDYDPSANTFTLPDEHAYFLASDGTDHYVGGLFMALPGALGAAPRVAEAFREGGGVSFAESGEEFAEAVDMQNRGMYRHRLASDWLPKMPEVVAALEAGAEALDVGCGVGRVSIELAKAFPKSRFLGVDLHALSVEKAREAARAEGVSDRVEFRAEPLSGLEPGRQFQFITACDCVHDLADPLGVLREIGGRLHPEGTFFVIEPRAADRLEDNINPLGAMFYGMSVFH